MNDTAALVQSLPSQTDTQRGHPHTLRAGRDPPRQGTYQEQIGVHIPLLLPQDLCGGQKRISTSGQCLGAVTFWVVCDPRQGAWQSEYHARQWPCAGRNPCDLPSIHCPPTQKGHNLPSSPPPSYLLGHFLEDMVLHRPINFAQEGESHLQRWEPRCVHWQDLAHAVAEGREGWREGWRDERRMVLTLPP